MKHETEAQLFYDGAWNAAPVLGRDPITITRGNPATAVLTLDNSSKDYSPRSAAGSLFGKIGQNTPLRILCDLDPLHLDDFTRTESNGWGFSPTAGGYFSAWSSGSLADFSVGGGAGNHVVTTAASYRMSYLIGQVNSDDPDVECYVTCPLPTGGDLEPCILLAVKDVSNYYMFRARITTAGAVELQLRSLVDGVETLEATASTTLTHAAATPLHLRARMSCGELQFKAWQGSTQPSTWQMTAYSDTIVRRGGIGFRSGRGTGNTNVNAQFAYDAVRITMGRTRFVGEVTSWIPERPIKGSGWTRITATGVRQRLGRGTDVLDSAHRTYVQSLSPLGYWPMEPGTRSTNLMDDSRPLEYSGSDVGWATYDGPPGSDKGPKFFLNDDRPPVSQIFAPIHGTSDDWTVSLWFRAHAGPESAIFFTPVVDFCQIETTGTVRYWGVEALSYPPTNQLEVSITGFDAAGDIISPTFGAIYDGEIIDDKWHHVWIQAEQSGGTASISISIDGGGGGGDSDFTYTNGALRGIWLPKRSDPSNVADPSMMHLAAWDRITPGLDYFEVWRSGMGWPGETAGARFLRLADHQDVLAYVDGELADTVAMGPQGLKKFLEQMEQIERTDDAIIYEPRAVLGLGMLSGQARLNRESLLTLSYTGTGIKPALRPVVGDAHIRNDVTASNPSGGERNVQVSTGPLGIGTVGRYATRVDVNRGTEAGPDDAALSDAAGWRTNQGTFDGTWYPEVTVDLDARPDLVPAVAAIDYGDVITLDDLPEDEALEAIEHQMVGGVETLWASGFRREVTFWLAPNAPYRVGVIGDTTGDTRDFLGWAETDGSTTVGGTLAGAATFSAATPSGPLWSTDADDYPQDLIVGGQQISVSACSGASSPQTFTVQVGGKQIVYPIPAGSQINVANPAILTQ